MFRRNKVLSMLENKQLPLGIQCFTGYPALIDVIGSTGFDWIMLDAEHSGLGREGSHEGIKEFLETQYVSAAW